jgi:uncharacterized protein YbjT (DUF2867 family)
MRLTVLAASGATGLELTRQALDRGHTVTAVARDPAKITLPETERLICVKADVRDPDSIADALAGSTTIVSGLGIAERETPGVLAAGAQAAVNSGADRIVWLGAIGTGASADAAGRLTRWLLRTFMRAEVPDKVTADQTVLAAGGTVFHAGPLSNGALSQSRRTVTLTDAPRRIFPARVSRATVAACMLDEAQAHMHPGATLIPLA